MDQTAKIGKYEILERVGRGGMGVLYRGRDPVLEREVAIKVMLADFAEDESARPRFYREARAVAKLQHRNIVTVFEFGEEEQNPYIVMEFLHGQDLSRRMRAEPPLTLVEKLEIVVELCAGLHYAHRQGVIHRDVKPGNIWLLPDGSVKLLDFGIAKIESSQITRAGSVFGTAGYMAPEQVQGGTSDGRADIFSAGVVLYELLSGRKPFDAATPTAVLARIIQDAPDPIDRFVAGLPPALIAVVMRSIERDPERRYQLAGDFAAELQTIRASLASGLEPQPLVEASTMPAPSSGRSRAGTAGGRAGDSGGQQPSGDRPQPTLVMRLVPLWQRAKQPPGLYYLCGAAGLLLALIVSMALWGARPTPTPATKGAATQEAAVSERGADERTPVKPEALPANRNVPPVKPAVDTSSLVATAVIHGSYPFEVNDGAGWSTAGTEHRVTVKGRKTVRLRSEEYLLNDAVELDASSRRTLDQEVPAAGSLTLRFAEACQAFIGSKDLGFPVNDLPLASGRHTVRLVCPDTPGPKQKQIVIRPGEPTKDEIK